MTPIKYYQSLVDKKKIEANLEQEQVLQYLNEVQKNLITAHQWRTSYLGRFIQWLKPSPPVKGLYLWGGVGIGKTMIMDCFFQSLPIPKLRSHFHEFLQRLHQELNEWQGRVNPLIHMAKRLARQYQVICFDEFLVTDAGDAVILTELFKVLFKYGVCLVTTSNVEPDRLYERGVSPQLFLPMVKLIHLHTQVFHLLLMKDYRRRLLKTIPVYYYPANEESEHALWHALQRFADDHPLLTTKPIELYGREIVVKQRTETVIWFDFAVICGRPRSQQDYLALAKLYKVILVSNLPHLIKVSLDQVVSFINLVDILYEAHIPLILSAAVPIEQLYPQGAFRSIFQRTESRLIEMQTEQWILN